MRAIALTLAASLALLAGCEDAGRAGLEARLQRLVGGSEAELVRRMGAPPTRVVEQGSTRYVSWMFSWPQEGVPQGAGTGEAERFCETTFAVEQGRVAGYGLHGDWCGRGGHPRVAPA